MAAGLSVYIVTMVARALYSCRSQGWLVRPAVGLLVMILAQLALGAATWVTKYGWPTWMSSFDFAARYVPTADGPMQAWIATAHVTIGSLILGTSLLVALRAGRLASRHSHTERGRTLLMEAAL